MFIRRLGVRTVLGRPPAVTAQRQQQTPHRGRCRSRAASDSAGFHLRLLSADVLDDQPTCGNDQHPEPHVYIHAARRTDDSSPTNPKTEPIIRSCTLLTGNLLILERKHGKRGRQRVHHRICYGGLLARIGYIGKAPADQSDQGVGIEVTSGARTGGIMLGHRFVGGQRKALCPLERLARRTPNPRQGRTQR